MDVTKVKRIAALIDELDALVRPYGSEVELRPLSEQEKKSGGGNGAAKKATTKTAAQRASVYWDAVRDIASSRSISIKDAQKVYRDLHIN